MKPTIYFVSGLPRSGSTLLMNLLGQNTSHHVTPTNGLIGLIGEIKTQWMNIEPFKAQGLDAVEPRISSSIRGLVYGFYEKELCAGKIIFDKNRAWLQNIELMEKVLNRKIKIICTVRDVKAVVASFEKLHRKSPLSRKIPNGPMALESQTVGGRTGILLAKGGVAGMSANSIRDAYVRGFEDRLIIVPYKDLVSEPHRMLGEIHERLNLPSFRYDTNNVTQITKEDDMLYGWGSGLHTIRPKVKRPTEHPWLNILPPEICNLIDKDFGDINKLASSTFEERKSIQQNLKLKQV